MITPVLFEKTFSEGIFRVYDGDPHQLNLSTVKQTHSKIVLPISTPQLATCEADGVCATWEELRGKIIAVKTADCLPVLLLGKYGASVVHAGWKGLATHILAAKEVKNLVPYEAYIGPCIHRCCFEVTAEFQTHFPHSQVIQRTDGTLRFDLVAEAMRQLTELYPGIKVQDSAQCTHCLTKYSSYRRDKTTRRIWNCFLAT